MLQKAKRPLRSKLFLTLFVLCTPKYGLGISLIQRRGAETTQEDEDARGKASARNHSLPPKRSQSVALSLEPTIYQYELRMPSQLESLSETAKRTIATSDEPPDTSFVAMLEMEEQALSKKDPLKVSARLPTVRQIQTSLLESGLALMVSASFLYSNQSTDFKILKDVLTGSMSALALVWLPVLLLQGNWVEMLSLTTLLIQPSVRAYVWTEFLPKSYLALKKMFLSEVWRRVWLVLLAPLPKPLFVPNPEDMQPFSWMPDWFQNGFLKFQDRVDKFAQSIIKSSIQQSVQGNFGIFYESLSGSNLEVSLIYEESTAGEALTETLSGALEVDNMDDNEISKYPEEELNADEAIAIGDGSESGESSEPELICDGDSCRFE